MTLLTLATGFILAWLAWHDWGAGLLTPYRGSDAAYYLHYAWMKAFVDPAGGQLKEIIPPSPYTCLLIGAYKLFGPELLAPYLVNAALYIATVMLMYALTRNLFDRRTGVIAGLITCLCGPLLFYAGLTMKVAAVAAFSAAALYSLERYLSRHRLQDLLLTAVFTTLLAVERNNALIFLPALMLLIAWPRTGAKTALLRTLILAGAVPLTIFLVTQPFSDAHRTSPLGANVYIGNSAIASGAYVQIPNIRNDLIGHHIDIYEQAAEQSGRPLSALEADWWWIQRTLRDIAEQPGRFLLLTGRKTLMMFSAYSPGTPSRYWLWRWHDPFLATALFDYGLILALALPGVVLALRRPDKQRWVCIHMTLTAAYAATVVAFFVLERYRIPVMIALIPLAAWAITCLGGKPRPRLLLAVAAIYSVSHLLNLANPQSSGWGPVNDRERRKFNEMRAENLEVYRHKVAAVRTNSAHAWDRLAYHYYKRDMVADGRLFLEKYNRLQKSGQGENR